MSQLAPLRARGRLTSLGLVRWVTSSATARAQHGHSHGGVECGHSHGGPMPPDERGTVPPAAEEQTVLAPPEPPAEDSGLPLVQRAKNLLACNWRAQLSTIERALGNSKQPRRPAIYGSLAPFAFLSDGQAVVFLAAGDAHVGNLEGNGLASLTVGATDPAVVATRLRSADGRTVMPRVSLLGELAPVTAGEVEYARRRATRAHVQALGAGAAVELAELLPYRLSVQDARWVDPRGGLHPVDLAEVSSSYVDPFAHEGNALLARLNGARDAPDAHRALCLAYLGAAMEEAHLVSVDRSGFTLLGRSASEHSGEWREFRFAFSSEIRERHALESTLEEMAAEARAHLAAGDEGTIA